MEPGNGQELAVGREGERRDHRRPGVDRRVVRIVEGHGTLRCVVDRPLSDPAPDQVDLRRRERGLVPRHRRLAVAGRDLFYQVALFEACQGPPPARPDLPPLRIWSTTVMNNSRRRPLRVDIDSPGNGPGRSDTDFLVIAHRSPRRPGVCPALLPSSHRPRSMPRQHVTKRDDDGDPEVCRDHGHSWYSSPEVSRGSRWLVRETSLAVTKIRFRPETRVSASRPARARERTAPGLQGGRRVVTGIHHSRLNRTSPSSIKDLTHHQLGDSTPGVYRHDRGNQYLFQNVWHIGNLTGGGI